MAGPRPLPEPRCQMPLIVALAASALAGCFVIGALVAQSIFDRVTGDRER